MTDPTVKDPNSAGISGEAAAEPVPRFREAFERIAAEIRAVPAADVVQINLEIPTAVMKVLGALEAIRSLRADIEKLPYFDMLRFDRLEDYTLALGHAHSVCLAAASQPRPIEELAEEGSELRETLMIDAAALVRRKVVDGARLVSVGGRGSTGHKNIAFDLLTVANVLRESWPAVAANSGIPLADVTRAEILADLILTQGGERTHNTEHGETRATSDRANAFTLFINTYDQARRAAIYLRWSKDDADRFVPSLYNSTRKKRRELGDVGDESTKAEPGATAGIGASETDEPKNDIPVGMPGSSPFSKE